MMPESQPPQPRLALRVGVTGHHPGHLHHAHVDVLRKQIHEVLQTLKRFALEHPRVSTSYRERDEPLLRLVSMLAEGADRYVAHQAISLGYELQCALPFGRDQYAKDFETNASSQEFDRLLKDTQHTTAILELDGSRDHKTEAHLAAGRVILSQSDVLRILLNPPRHSKKEQDEELSTTPQDYFSEKQRWLNWGSPWIPFRNLWLFRLTLPKVFAPIFALSGVEEWVAVLKSSDAFSDSAIPLIDTARLCDHYGWANGLAEYYANLYRSAFAMNYLMGALAVLCAFLHFALEPLQVKSATLTFILLELALLGAIPIIYRIGRWRRWHEKWIDYRLLAEYMRQLFFLIPLGPGELSSPHLPKYLSAGDPKGTWMYWHYLALRREIGIVGGDFTPAYLDSVRSFLDSGTGIRGQIDYHKNNADRLEKLDSRFRFAGGALFVFAAVAAFIAFLNLIKAEVHGCKPTPGEIFFGLIATSGPAFGAALAGIRTQAEFERVKKRSHAMLQTLQRICKELSPRNEGRDKISYAALNLIVAETGQLMVDELLDWRIVFKDRPLPEPG